MSIPRGAKWIYESGRKIGVQLSNGNTVSRGEGERLGARESGYKNASQERKSVGERRSFLQSDKFGRYKSFEDRALKEARRTGAKVDKRQLKTAYWRAHVAGQNFARAPKGTKEAREAQREQQSALAALGRLTGERREGKVAY